MIATPNTAIAMSTNDNQRSRDGFVGVRALLGGSFIAIGCVLRVVVEEPFARLRANGLQVLAIFPFALSLSKRSAISFCLRLPKSGPGFPGPPSIKSSMIKSLFGFRSLVVLT
jgi:hypothetical protein